MISLNSRGLNQEEIAQELHVDQSTVSRDLQYNAQILTELQNSLSNVKDQSVLLSYSNVGWRGSISDTRSHSAMQDVKGDSKLQLQS